MTKIINFFKTTTGIIILVVVGAALLLWGLSALSKSNNERNLQRALDHINARIEQASASRSTDMQSLISERDALIEIIKNTI